MDTKPVKTIGKHCKMALTNRVALVTGASRGIGEAIALGYAAAGAHVVLAARDMPRLNMVATRITDAGGSCEVAILDVSEYSTIGPVLDRVVERHGRLDILCNNAGVSTARGNVIDVSAEQLARVLAVNVVGLHCCCKEALPHMIKKGYGRIVNIGSGSAYMCNPGESAYSSSKAAVNAFTATLSKEIHESGILVNAMSPGSIRTDMNPAGPSPPTTAVPTAIWLASLPANGPNGRFFRFDEEIPIVPTTHIDFRSNP